MGIWRQFTQLLIIADEKTFPATETFSEIRNFELFLYFLASGSNEIRARSQLAVYLLAADGWEKLHVEIQTISSLWSGAVARRW